MGDEQAAIIGRRDLRLGGHPIFRFPGAGARVSGSRRREPDELLIANRQEGGEPRIEPEADELAVARGVLSSVEPLLYARVDLARGPDGAPLLMELEAFEPSLFLRACPEGADRLAAAIVRRL